MREQGTRNKCVNLTNTTIMYSYACMYSWAGIRPAAKTEIKPKKVSVETDEGSSNLLHMFRFQTSKSIDFLFLDSFSFSPC